MIHASLLNLVGIAYPSEWKENSGGGGDRSEDTETAIASCEILDNSCSVDHNTELAFQRRVC
jgi:hypothetical protein